MRNTLDGTGGKRVQRLSRMLLVVTLLLMTALAACSPGSSARVSPASAAGPPASSLPTDQIAFVRDNHIWLVRPDGMHLVQLTKGQPEDGGDYSPAWSPDRRLVAFTHHSDANGDESSRLGVVPAAGGQGRTWGFDGEIVCGFAPDSRRLAIVEAVSSPIGPHPVEAIRVWVFDLRTQKRSLVYQPPDLNWYLDDVSWSPDGKALLLGGTRQDSVGRRYGVLTLATSRLAWLSARWLDEARWSPDGKQLVVSSSTDTATTIALAGIDGTTRCVLVRGGDGDVQPSVYGPSFSPDGSWVSYCTYEDTDPPVHQIWAVRVDGTGNRRVTTNGDGAVWSAR